MSYFVRKMLKHTLRQNCISCVLGPLFQYGWVIGLPPIIMTCNHKRSILRPKISSPKIALLSTFLIVTLQICAAISFGLKIFGNTDDTKNIFEVLLTVPSFSICLGSVFILTCIPLQGHKIRRWCELLQASLESFRESKVIVLLTIKDIAHLRLCNYIPFLSWLSTSIAFYVMLLFNLEKLHLNILEGIGLVVCYCVGAVTTFFVYYVYNLICFLTKSCQHQLARHLRNNLKFRYYDLNKRLTIVNNKFVKLSTSESIAPYIQFNSQLIVASRLFNSCINPCLLTTVVIFIFAQAAIYFQCILRVVKNEPIFFYWPLTVINSQLFSSILLFHYYILIIWKLETLVSNRLGMLSFYAKKSITS